MHTTVAGRYRPLRELGRGAAGAVWLCEDEVLRREVAVKQVGRLPGETTHDVARALREARSSAALHHPGVVAVFDVVEEGATTWLVMEHVPSRPLSEVVADDGPLQPRRAAALGAQVAGGLAAAHHEGTVHRDVKPGNILVTEDDVAKISDFGIARTTGDDQLTRSGLVVGTPAYFSPELARGGEPSLSSDVWALGATLYAAVEGHPPYPPRDNVLAQLTEIATAPPPAPERAGPLGPVIGRMMHPDPDQRPSMAEVEAALQTVAAGRDPVTAGEPTQAVTVPVASTASAEASAAPAAAAAAAPDRGEAPPRRRRWPVALVAAVLLALLGGGLAVALSGDPDEAPTAGEPSTSAPPSPTREPTREPSRSPSPTPSPTPTPTPTPTAEPESEEPETVDPSPRPAQQAEPATEPAAFVSGYYGLLPGDPAPAWDLLGPAIQQRVGSFEDYAAFWRTVDAVEVVGTERVDEQTVDTTISYTTDGSRQTEVRRLALDRRGDGWVIASDDVVG